MQLLAGLVFSLAFCISTGEVKVESKTEGEKVSMDCTFTMGSSAYSYYFFWYRQHPGSGLQYILCCRQFGDVTWLMLTLAHTTTQFIPHGCIRIPVLEQRTLFVANRIPENVFTSTFSAFLTTP
ncbi:hypothetical protein GJAV_G00112140 [Gymnothorax javanicus]|nr:hypothetical protein GJAV_G00112140 [Gymnothorax javanicus]